MVTHFNREQATLTFGEIIMCHLGSENVILIFH